MFGRMSPFLKKVDRVGASRGPIDVKKSLLTFFRGLFSGLLNLLL